MLMWDLSRFLRRQNTCTQQCDHMKVLRQDIFRPKMYRRTLHVLLIFKALRINSPAQLARTTSCMYECQHDAGGHISPKACVLRLHICHSFSAVYLFRIVWSPFTPPPTPRASFSIEGCPRKRSNRKLGRQKRPQRPFLSRRRATECPRRR